MHGRGSYKWPNGDNYIGEYHNGLRNGYGEMIYHSKNEHYKGRWQDGLYHGQGQYWYVKFIYSEKVSKFCEISTLLLTGTTLDKIKVEI